MSSNDVNRYNRYISDILSKRAEYDFSDKRTCVDYYIKYMLVRCQSMFEWQNLPETIPARYLELYIQSNGNACIAESNNNLYAFTGGMGGEPNPYYMPTIYTVSNPALNLSKNYKIDSDCVIIPNDSLYMGLIPLLDKYVTLMVENELSMRIATINSRIVNLITAPDDRSRASAEKYIQDIVDGKQGVIAENPFLDGIKSQPYGSTGSTNHITNLIEMEQYLKASLYNEIGLNANYNMKRESINSGESELNKDALIPLVDDMLKCRMEGAEKINRMFGTNISVKLGSSWEDNQQELDILHDMGDDANVDA